MRRYCSYVAIGLLLLGCTQRQEPVSPPWISQEDTLTTDEFDLPQIEQAGELIAVTLSGPETYYEFRGRQLGLHYLLCEQFARHLGVKLRIETCRDTVELLSRLADGDVDLAAIDFSHDSLSPGWLLGANNVLFDTTTGKATSQPASCASPHFCTYALQRRYISL